MLLDDTPEYDAVWDKVFATLKFRPSGSDYREDHPTTGKLPFTIACSYEVYAIEHMTDEQRDLMDAFIRKSLILCAHGKRWYALDWYHSAFKFDPQNLDEQQSFWVEDERYWGGGYYAYFPSFYPDGDYYFFIDEDFQNGYLGHPWRQEIWVFGAALLDEINKIYQKLGWERIF
ncbi:MAG: DUF2716 domain-containing protein [Clostridiales bacterium]|nr:DUF2716 domain-containing protein [Clostridiales bacterium]